MACRSAARVEETLDGLPGDQGDAIPGGIRIASTASQVAIRALAVSLVSHVLLLPR